MTRAAAELRSSDDPARRELLRTRFLQYCDAFRAAVGMGEAEYPKIPDEISKVSRFTPEALDAMPYELVEEQSTTACTTGDFATSEVLCAELDRRDELAGSYPDDMAAEEERRWAELRRDGFPDSLDHLDPLTHPIVRATAEDAKGRELRMRAEYEAWIEQQILDAEEATRGNLYNARGRNAALDNPNVTPRSLWVNHIMAQHYASEELRRYWEQHPRHTFSSFTEMWSGQAGPAREQVAKSSLLAI